MGTLYSEESLKKNIMFGLFGSLAPAGFVFGSLLGALFGQLSWWPWAFWTMGLLCLAFGVLTVFTVPESDHLRHEKPTADELDLVGTFLSVSGLVLVNFAWNQAFVTSWVKVYNGVCLGVGISMLIAFTWWEGRARYPLVPTKYFTMVTTLTLVVLCAGFASFGIWEYYYFQFSRVLRGYSALAITAQLTPIILSGALAAVCSGYILDRFGASTVLLYVDNRRAMGGGKKCCLSCWSNADKAD
jgi:MFS family permease